MTGAIVGGIVGCCALVLCVVALVVWLMSRKEPADEYNQPVNPNNSVILAPPSNYECVSNVGGFSDYSSINANNYVDLPVSSPGGSIASDSAAYGKLDAIADDGDVDAYRVINANGWQ